MGLVTDNEPDYDALEAKLDAAPLQADGIGFVLFPRLRWETRDMARVLRLTSRAPTPTFLTRRKIAKIARFKNKRGKRRLPVCLQYNVFNDGRQTTALHEPFFPMEVRALVVRVVSRNSYQGWTMATPSSLPSEDELAGLRASLEAAFSRHGLMVSQVDVWQQTFGGEDLCQVEFVVDVKK
jgi:hypothetical protein